ncbi:MAG: hypothetical protein DMG60_19065 [Acidobacteria bacterium]|nr:MAG: hypothetical protein DMG60_19065 [Acidobacteriota bacterium]
MADIPPLKPLHSDTSLSAAQLAKLEQLSTDQLKESLLLGKKECLKAKRDELILDVHHRILVLRNRGIDIDALPREIVEGEMETL